MAMDTHDTCYIDLLHDDILSNILSRLPEPTSIAHSALACKPWCHIINIHGILRRHRPPTLCGVFRENFASCLGKRRLIFSPTDQMASPDLVEITNNFSDDLSESIPGGPWSIADSYEGLLLLVRYHRRHANSRSSWRVLAIFNPVTRDLQELPPTAKSRPYSPCFFVGAAILRDDDAGNGRCSILRGGSDLPRFKVVCVVALGMSIPGVFDDECIVRTSVHSAGPRDKWSVVPHFGRTRWSIAALEDHVGDTLFKILRASRLARDAPWGRSTCNGPGMMMLNMRTGRPSLLAPQLVSRIISQGYTIVDYRKGEDDKLWFVRIHDGLLLRLYSHPKPPEEESSTTRLGAGQWILEREVQLRLQTDELTNAAGELRAHHLQSRNGYVFFGMNKYGYFAVCLRSMHVQRLVGVSGEYRGRLYPFLLRQDL